MTFDVLIIILFAVWLVALTISIIKIYIQSEALKNSTHQVQYIDPTQAFSPPMTDEQKARIMSNFEEL
jgi:hypothetical protein